MIICTNIKSLCEFQYFHISDYFNSIPDKLLKFNLIQFFYNVNIVEGVHDHVGLQLEQRRPKFEGKWVGKNVYFFFSPVSTVGQRERATP